jgi:hypothetical protein
MIDMKKTILGIYLAIIILIGIVGAAPAMVSVWPLTCTTATFNANGGAAGDAWFEWGQHSTGPYIWTTPNQTIGAGAFSDYQWGPPMLTGTTYYVIPCDTTGCGAELGFFVPNATRINQTRFGADTVGLMRGGFNITQVSLVVMKPFSAPFPSPYAAAIPYGLLFFFILSGMYLRGRDMLIPMMLVMVSGAGLMWGGTGLGVPPDFITYVGQPLLYIGIAGVIFSWFTR